MRFSKINYIKKSEFVCYQTGTLWTRLRSKCLRWIWIVWNQTRTWSSHGFWTIQISLGLVCLKNLRTNPLTISSSFSLYLPLSHVGSVMHFFPFRLFLFITVSLCLQHACIQRWNYLWDKETLSMKFFKKLLRFLAFCIWKMLFF